MKARPDDVWVVSYPKCGTTWTQEMVWQVANNLDLEGGKVMLDERFPFLEAETLWKPSEFGWSGRMIAGLFKVWEWGTSWRWNRPKSWFGYKSTVEMLEDSSKRRFIKSHLPLSHLPENLLTTAKVIYVARNPRDAMIRKLFNSIRNIQILCNLFLLVISVSFRGEF